MSQETPSNLDAATIKEFRERILEDIKTKGVNEVIVDTVMSLFAMEAFARNLQCVTTTVIQLALKKKVFTEEEFSVELQEALDEVSKQLDSLIGDLEDAAKKEG